MRPAPISDAVAADHPGRRLVVSGPDGDLIGPIQPIEAMVQKLPNGKVYDVRLVLEEGDLAKLQAGGAVWVSFLGSIVPFNVHVGP